MVVGQDANRQYGFHHLAGTLGGKWMAMALLQNRLMVSRWYVAPPTMHIQFIDVR